eukprot:6181723-Pleurochrysis_carterae.AAC.3
MTSYNLSGCRGTSFVGARRPAQLEIKRPNAEMTQRYNARQWREPQDTGSEAEHLAPSAFLTVCGKTGMSRRGS